MTQCDYKTTKAWIAKFQAAVDSTPLPLSDDLLAKAVRAAMLSQISDLQEDLDSFPVSIIPVVQ